MNLPPNIPSHLSTSWTHKNITAIIPARNEASTIETVIKQVPRDLVHQIIVVDGHSEDSTGEIATKAGAEVYKEEGRGYGAGLKTGLRYATGDYITFIDADGSYDTNSLIDMRHALEKGNDVVFCSRYLPESGSDDDTWIRKGGNLFFSFLLRFIHKVKITDALFLYVLVRREVFDAIVMESSHFEYCIEFPIRIHKAGFAYIEIPSKEKPRIAGYSKVNVCSDGLRILWTLLKG